SHCVRPHLPHSPLFPYTTLFRSTSIPVIAPILVTPFQKIERIIGGPKHVARPAHANTASQNTESSGFRAMMIANAPSTAVATREDRKSTRLNSSHVSISYAVFCL